MAENQKNYHAAARSKKSADAAREQRRAARETVLTLLFETEYHEGDTPEAIFTRAAEARDVDTKNRYIRKEYFAIMERLPEIDALLGRHARGWRTDRLSRVSRAILRLGAYELVFAEKIPAPVAINEAVELAKKYDDPKARPFINGVLHAIKKELDENGGTLPVIVPAETADTVKTEEIPAEIPAEEPDADPALQTEALDAETPDAPADAE